MSKFSDMLVPAIVAGVVIAILYFAMNYMPIVENIQACFCGVWLLGGGILASSLLKRKKGRLELIDGAIVGALTAFVFSILIAIIASGVVMLGIGSVGLEGFMQGLFPEYEYNAGTMVFALMFGLLFAFIFHLIPSLVLCVIGGILGAKVLE
ncbi:MAG: hypothetical protein JW778_05340 [Candidatus Altiarchaeota archaeon]|nr:hypothetical protein [Candidatus Altiarchaeota archaeon]